MIGSLTIALEEMTLHSQELKKENDVMKDEMAQLKANNDTVMGENRQLLTVLHDLALDNNNLVEKINSLTREIALLQNEILNPVSY